MAVRNGAAFLAEALDSVRGQTLEDLELIVVDDGSSDRTPEILSDFAGRDDRIRVISQSGRGVSHARSRACSQARSPYLANLDADDVALPERLALQVAYLDSHPDVVAVGGAGVFIDESGAEIGAASYPSDAEEVAGMLFSGRAPLIHSAATMRVETFRATSGYRPAMEIAQDYDLWLRLAPHGRITNIPDTVVRYRFHRSQASTQNIEKTATAVQAALASARARASGEPDPLDAAESLDSSLLQRLGVRPEDIAAQEVAYGLWLARTLARAGLHDRAAPLWGLCSARAHATAQPRATRARVLRARAEACGWMGRRLRAMVLRLRAGMLEPRAAAAGLRRLVARPASRA